MVNVFHVAILSAAGGFLFADAWARVKDALTSVVVFLGQKNEGGEED